MILPVLKDISRQEDSTIEEKSCQVGNRLSLRLLEASSSPMIKLKFRLATVNWFFRRNKPQRRRDAENFTMDGYR
jgi:hypothetical protein